LSNKLFCCETVNVSMMCRTTLNLRSFVVQGLSLLGFSIQAQ